MIATSTSRSSQFIPVPAPRPRLLLVCDSADRLKQLLLGIDQADFEIATASSIKELQSACREIHDLVALDVSPLEIASILRSIRTSKGHSEIPILVESERIINAPSLAGVLPGYRAMPCSHQELLTLLHRRKESSGQTRERRGML